MTRSTPAYLLIAFFIFVVLPRLWTGRYFERYADEITSSVVHAWSNAVCFRFYAQKQLLL